MSGRTFQAGRNIAGEQHDRGKDCSKRAGRHRSLRYGRRRRGRAEAACGTGAAGRMLMNVLFRMGRRIRQRRRGCVMRIGKKTGIGMTVTMQACCLVVMLMGRRHCFIMNHWHHGNGSRFVMMARSARRIDGRSHALHGQRRNQYPKQDCLEDTIHGISLARADSREATPRPKSKPSHGGKVKTMIQVGERRRELKASACFDSVEAGTFAQILNPGAPRSGDKLPINHRRDDDGGDGDRVHTNHSPGAPRKRAAAGPEYSRVGAARNRPAAR